MISLKQICLDLPGFNLKDISLDIREKDFFALIGPTGSGKSLLLEVIMGLVPVTSGSLFLADKEITDLPVHKRKIAIVYQDYALFPHLNVCENIMYGVRYYSKTSKKIMQEFDFLVSTLGLERILARKPHLLSGGEKQRTALARALILNPSVLLLDEPLSALDPLFHEDAKQLLKKIHTQLDMTTIMVSHNFSEVLYLANRGAVIRNGEIRQQGNMTEIFEKPNSTFTASFVGMNNVFPLEACRKAGITALCEPGPDQTYAGIRPEDISVTSNDDIAAFENIFAGRIKEIEDHGLFLKIRLEAGELEFEAVCPRNLIKDDGIRKGNSARIGFHPDAVHFF